ncbi:MAG: UDP-N-acetylmuramoyl-L-alanyl-D-glutamate--2,6-diaminopimelate ligase [Oscillospiraceae bacterium]|nr:UDP-N-acetylmuramoyl-L-alanyl-D-glutamate--2,6-diaminopimelate ligase [Oscillospiraceae bacterium]
MTLRELLRDVEVYGPLPEGEVSALTGDSRQVEPGSVFFCIAGTRTDGHDHAAGALKKGAAAIVCERDLGLERQILVDSTRAALGICASNFFGRPTEKLKLIGITGTNGKTTTTYLVKHILEAAGKTVGLIGTIRNEIADVTLPAKYTTPDPVGLHAMFARMAQAGCEYVVMEASSHALDQQRLAGVRFAAAAFTNLTQDHLDYHGSMEAYFAAKRKLFDICDVAVVNADDEYGRRVIEGLGCPHISFSQESGGADLTAHDVHFTAKGSRFVLMRCNDLHRVTLRMPGYFSVSNALAAAGCCLATGIEMQAVVEGLASCPGVPGRIEILPTDTPYTVIRDYAHSPDGLQKILETLKEFATGRVVCLFGAAGNRDRAKRPIMGEIVSRLADFVILTSDNPRDEDQMRIIEDVLPGVKKHKTPYEVIPDRFAAIEWGLQNARPDDILLLAGKGHEDYQVLHYGTINFDEKVIVAQLLSEMKGKGASE